MVSPTLDDINNKKFSFEDLSSFTVKVLKDIARARHYTGFSTFKKQELIQFIINNQDGQVHVAPPAVLVAEAPEGVLTLEQLSSMTVKALKQLARERNYKGFSRLKKDELIPFILDQQTQVHVAVIVPEENIDNNQLTEEQLSAMSVAQLKSLAKGRNYKGYSRLKKNDLVDFFLRKQLPMEEVQEIVQVVLDEVAPNAVLAPLMQVISPANQPNVALSPLNQPNLPPPPQLPPRQQVFPPQQPIVLSPTPPPQVATPPRVVQLTPPRVATPPRVVQPTPQQMPPRLNEFGLPLRTSPIHEEKVSEPVVEIIRPIGKRKKKAGLRVRNRAETHPREIKKSGRRHPSFLPVLTLPESQQFQRRPRYMSDEEPISSSTTTGLDLLIGAQEYTELQGKDLSVVLNQIQSLPSEDTYLAKTPNVDLTIRQTLGLQ